ncbi:MAG: hypothetical protein V1685_04185 [Parcubacteria group bacterium]
MSSLGTTLWIIALALVALVSLFFRLKKYIPMGYRRLSWMYFLFGVAIFALITNMMLNGYYRYLDATVQLVISVIVIMVVAIAQTRFEKKYK